MKKFSLDPLWHVLIFILFSAITFGMRLSVVWHKLVEERKQRK